MAGKCQKIHLFLYHLKMTYIVSGRAGR